jgi:hypothetical protein
MPVNLELVESSVPVDTHSVALRLVCRLQLRIRIAAAVQLTARHWFWAMAPIIVPAPPAHPLATMGLPYATTNVYRSAKARRTATCATLRVNSQMHSPAANKDSVHWVLVSPGLGIAITIRRMAVKRI